MTEIQLNNNLISKTVNNNLKSSEQIQQSGTNIKKIDSIPDSFESSNAKKANTNTNSNSKKYNIINGVISTGLFIGLFFLPDLIFAIKNKKSNNLLKKYQNFKPLIGEFITNKQKSILKNGNIKVTLENINGRFKDNEIMILNKQGKMIQRILIKKEEMPNGKLVVKSVKSYKGNNLTDNNEILNNEKKYLYKGFKRKKIASKEYQTSVYIKGNKPVNTQFYATSNGEPILRVKENDTQKENMAFLYAGDKCIGTDTQIIPKDKNKPSFNILNIPEANIKNQIYEVTKNGKQYDQKLLNKLIENF